VAQKLHVAKRTSWTLKTDTIPLLRRDEMKPLAIWWDPSAVHQIDEIEDPVAASYLFRLHRGRGIVLGLPCFPL
jgi:hypothetical protein